MDSDYHTGPTPNHQNSMNTPKMNYEHVILSSLVYLFTPATIEIEKSPVVGSVRQTLHLGSQTSEEPEDW